VGGDRVDFFVSHAGADRAWAEWVAWQLAAAGYTVELDVWHWKPGQNFVLAMNDALARCDRVVALLSPAYFERDRFTTEEWSTALLRRSNSGPGRLIPVRIEPMQPEDMPEILRSLIFCDVFGMHAAEARRVLLSTVAEAGSPDGEPAFPSHELPAGQPDSPRMPGSLPPVWTIPTRNPAFTGRDDLLAAIRQRLLAGDRALVQALHGMGGVGKTQLAAEYAHRYAGAYDLAWWINAEQAALIGDEFAALGLALGCVHDGARAEVARAAVLAELRRRDRWLLVFDNAASPADIVPWLPSGRGHVLITSRESGWAEIAELTEVGLLTRPESVALLRARAASLSQPDAGRLASQLGDLPLAMAQAAGFMAETGTSASEYLDLLRTQAGALLAEGTPWSYPRSLAAATRLIADRLDHEDPAAGQLARLCAFLAPEPIPQDLFANAGVELPGELAARAADPLAWRQTVARLSSQSLTRTDHRGIVMHRLTQAILRDRLTPDQAAATRQHADALLVANDPGDPANPANWPRWAAVAPHLLAADPAATTSPGLRRMARNACRYLLARSDWRAGYDLATALREQWRERFGDDNEDTLAAATYLGWALRNMGHYAQARDLHQDTLDRYQRLLGDEHPDTLNASNNLAVDLYKLGQLPAARRQYQDALDRRRRVLGEEHPEKLNSASNLATVLRVLGEVPAARDLHQDILDRKRRVLGNHHPDTLTSAHNLATDLRDLGDVIAARELDQDTLDQRRAVLGENHPDTLNSAISLASDLRQIGDLHAARQLDKDTLDRRRQVLGENHPDTLNSVANLDIDQRLLSEASPDPEYPC
jgi:tetratricopeptide (TPR) repeat protein